MATDDMITNFKFVDDKTIALNHSDDPSQLLQDRLDLMSKEADQNCMVINAKKCHSITFNFSDSNHPPENLHINNAPILREKAIKLLGVEITDSLKFSNNMIMICKKSKFYVHIFYVYVLISVWNLEFLYSCRKFGSCAPKKVSTKI